MEEGKLGERGVFTTEVTPEVTPEVGYVVINQRSIDLAFFFFLSREILQI